MKAKYKDKLVEIIELKSSSFVDYLQKQSKTVPLFSVDYICAVNKEYQIYRYVDVKANRVKYALEYIIDYNTAYAIIYDTKIDFEDLVKWFEREILKIGEWLIWLYLKRIRKQDYSVELIIMVIYF